MRKMISLWFRSGGSSSSKRVGRPAPKADATAAATPDGPPPPPTAAAPTHVFVSVGAEPPPPANGGPHHLRQHPADDKQEAIMWKRRSAAWRWAVDVGIYVLVLALLAAVEFGVMPSPRTGFYCNDPKINFEFRGDTVSTSVLLAGSFTLPWITLWLVESTMAFARRRSRGGAGGVLGCLRSGARPAGRWYREYVLGLGVVMFVTDAMKLLVSEPRPHFLDTCRPDANCTLAARDVWTWVDDFECTNKRQSAYHVRDSMRSFPSGHTSVSVYTSLFIMIFLRRRMLRDVTLLLVPWLQGLFLLWTLTCSLTRITDHRHHWWDVLAGSLLGVFSALYTIRMFCEDFCEDEDDGDESLRSSPEGLGRGDGKSLPSRPLLNGHVAAHGHGHILGHGKDCSCPMACPDAVPARRLLSSSSSCASSLTAAEERELREVSTTS